MGLLKVVKELQPAPQNTLELLQQAKDLFAPAGESERSNDQIEQLDKVLGFAQKLAALRVGGDRRSGWDTALDFAKEIPNIASPILQFVSSTMAMRNGGMAPRAAPPGPPGPPPSWDPYRDQAATLAYARALRNRPAPPSAPSPPPAGFYAPQPAPPPPSPADGATPDQQLLAIFQQYGQLVLKALNNGVPGYDFAGNIIELFGAGTHAAFANYGKDQIVSVMMTIPEFQIFGQPRLSRFAEEFVNPQEFGDEKDDDTEKAASAAR